MRITSLVLVLVPILTCNPLAAWAQPAPQPVPQAGRVITRDQFVQRAATMAGRRFDMIDTGHTGTITVAQLRIWRAEHARQGAGPGAAGPASPE